MELTNIEELNAPGKAVKKEWKKPEVEIIGLDVIASGFDTDGPEGHYPPGSFIHDTFFFS